MTRSTLALVLASTLLAACGAVTEPDQLDDLPGDHVGPGAAGSAPRAGSPSALAGAGGAGGSDAADGPAHAPKAGSGSRVGSAFGSAGGSGDEGSAGAAGGPAAGSGGAAGAAGAPVPSCPDADADGTCDDADECPAGSDADADDNGYADACEQPLWTIAQHGYKTFDFAANIHPCDFHFDLTSSGTNCATHQVQSQFCTADGAGVDEIITERSSVNIPEDFSGCTEFTPSWRLEQQPRVNGPVSTQAPHHIAYLRVQATGSIAANAPNYTATIDVTWTAYGY